MLIEADLDVEEGIKRGIKERLAISPIAFTISTYSGWDGTNETMCNGNGAHAMTIIGWDDDRKNGDGSFGAFIITDSNDGNDGRDLDDRHHYLPYSCKINSEGDTVLSGSKESIGNEWYEYKPKMEMVMMVNPRVSEGGLGDKDGDNIINGLDNCIDIPNWDQSDIDMDGVGDMCDNCPNVYNPYQEDKNQDGIGDACDSDSDGEEDSEDNCPSTFNPSQSDIDGDRVGDACDNDRDGDNFTVSRSSEKVFRENYKWDWNKYINFDLDGDGHYDFYSRVYGVGVNIANYDKLSSAGECINECVRVYEYVKEKIKDVNDRIDRMKNKDNLCGLRGWEWRKRNYPIGITYDVKVLSVCGEISIGEFANVSEDTMPFYCRNYCELYKDKCSSDTFEGGDGKAFTDYCIKNVERCKEWFKNDGDLSRILCLNI